MAFDERRPLSLRAWLATPVVFLTAVLGLIGLVGLLLDADWPATLSSGQFGAAAAVTGMLAWGVDWRAAWQRWLFGLSYPAAVFVVGLLLDHRTMPTLLAAVTGAPALITLTVLIAREHNRVIPIA